MKTETETKHTPTPWEVSAVNENGIVGKQWDGSVTPLAIPVIPAWHENRRKGSEEADANAAFIVRAVNAHEELLKLVQRADKYIHMNNGPDEDCDYCRAIKKAETINE